MYSQKNGLWVIDGDTAISQWCVDQGRLDWDWQLLAKIKPLLARRGELRGCIDAGAYIGDYTATFAEWFKTVFAFEPQRDAYECLLRNVTSENVHCFNAAVGPSGTTYGIDRCDNNPGASQMKVGLGTLQYLCLDGLRGIDFIKIDVEGNEPLVLEACLPIIKRDHPFMLIEQREYDGNEAWVYDFLGKNGYTAEVVSGVKPISYDLWCE